MARSHSVAALAIASLALFITFHLISLYGLPCVEFFQFQHGSEGTAATPNQIPLVPPASQPALSEEGPLYLLGVGKADITG